MLVGRAHKNPKTILGKAIENNERFGGGQDLLLKLTHTGISRCALRNAQQRGVLGSKEIHIDPNVGVRLLDCVGEKFSTAAEEKKRSYPGQLLPQRGEKLPDLRLHLSGPISSLEPLP